MRHFTIAAVLFFVVAFSAHSQKVAVKSNLLYDATATINLGFEFALGKSVTLDISGNYNPWQFGNKEWKHWMVQPEIRFWTCEKFEGSFFGLHGHYAEYSFGGFGFLPLAGYVNGEGFIGGNSHKESLKNARYQGHLYGAGISYGYQWIIGKRWSLEATIGAGFAIADMERWPLADCGTATKLDKKVYWGLTKVGLSLIYFIH